MAHRMRRMLRSWVEQQPEPGPLPRPDVLATTVVIPCFNHVEHLPLAVQSLVEQTLEQFDTVLIDDSSRDGTNALLTGLADQLSAKGAVTLLSHRQNRGQAATLNEAIGLARTPLVTVLNDDDWLTCNALEMALATWARHPEVALVGAGSRWFAGSGRPPAIHDDDPVAVSVFDPAQVRSFRRPTDLNMTHSGMTLSRMAWEVVGGYRSHMRERVVPYSDRDLQLRVATLYSVAVVDTPLVWWRSDSSVDAGRNT